MWPRAISSIESAITSRRPSDAFMPSVPIVMPSLMATVLNSMGVPPAARTPSFTCSASSRRLKLHGIVSVHVLAMPTMGRSMSRVGQADRLEVRARRRAVAAVVEDAAAVAEVVCHGAREIDLPCPAGQIGTHREPKGDDVMIKAGDKLPADAKLMEIGEAGPQAVTLGDLTKGRTVVFFAVPGAFTPTCSMKHLPGFVEKAARSAGRRASTRSPACR